jgi:CelD/BcsL family acetyltransferase involved in cellulose biosynthesis
MQIDVYKDLDSLSSIADAWDQLSMQCPQENPIMSHAWLSCYLECCCQSGDWIVITVVEQGKLIAVLPLVKRQAVLFGFTISFLQLPKNDHTLSVDAIVLDEKQEVLRKLHAIAFQQFPSALYIEYSRIDGVSHNLKWFGRALGIFAQIDLNAYGYALKPCENYQSYYDALSKNHKNNIKRWLNKLKQCHQVAYLYSSDGDIKNFNSVFELEHSGWKGASGSSVLSSDQSRKYFFSLSKSLAKKGWLQYQILSVDDECIAANFSVKFGKTILLWKLAYAETHSKMSPGSLLLLNTIHESYLQNAETRIDLMTNEAWYENWGMEKRPFYDAWIYRWSYKSLILMLLKAGRLKLSSIKKSLKLGK